MFPEPTRSLIALNRSCSVSDSIKWRTESCCRYTLRVSTAAKLTLGSLVVSAAGHSASISFTFARAPVDCCCPRSNVNRWPLPSELRLIRQTSPSRSRSLTLTCISPELEYSDRSFESSHLRRGTLPVRAHSIASNSEVLPCPLGATTNTASASTSSFIVLAKPRNPANSSSTILMALTSNGVNFRVEARARQRLSPTSPPQHDQSRVWTESLGESLELDSIGRHVARHPRAEAGGGVISPHPTLSSIRPRLPGICALD